MVNGGDVDDSLQLLQAVTKVSSMSSPSRNSREERMDASASGEAPARNNGRSRALKMGEKVKTMLY
jgi:hypothetical protein